MALNADTLLDRIHLKNQAKRWRMIALVVAIVAVLLVMEDFGGIRKGIGASHIARFTLDEIIFDDVDRHDLMQDIAADDNVKALILRIDSPGGSTVASEELYLDLLEIAEKKPVVCTMRSFATSGSYLAALGCDHIFAREGTLTGSVGVIMQTAEITELADKLGINPITVRSGDLKGAPTPFEKFTAKEQKLVQGIIDDFQQYFLALVKRERSLTDEQLAAIEDGRVFSARQALDLNLIDAIGGEEEAVAWLAEKHGINPELKVIETEMPSDKQGLEKLLDDYASSIFLQNVMVRLDGLVSIWQPATLL